jgi:hypothetical protein
MFGRGAKFEPEGYYDGYGYKVIDDGKVDVNLDGRITRFGSIEEMVAALDHAASRRAADILAQPLSGNVQESEQPPKKRRSGCGCLMLILIGVALVYLVSGSSNGSKIADIINSQFGRVCEAKAEGLFSDTLRLDWTAATTKMHVITVMAAIGQSKETLYSKGIRYLKFPNDSGGYNIIDWKTGDKSSINERAPYHF